MNTTNTKSTIPTVESIVEQYDADYAALKAPFNAALQQLDANPNYTAQGKMEKLKSIESDFRAQAEAYKSRAVNAFQDWVEIFDRDIKAEREKQAKEERAILGDALYADFLRRDVERATKPQQVVDLFNGASDEFTKRVIGRAALSFLGPRVDDDLEVFSAIEEIKQGMYGNAIDIKERKQAVYESAKSHAEHTYNPDAQNEVRRMIGLPDVTGLARLKQGF